MDIFLSSFKNNKNKRNLVAKGKKTQSFINELIDAMGIPLGEVI
jgi:hypothetical protein